MALTTNTLGVVVERNTLRPPRNKRHLPWRQQQVLDLLKDHDKYDAHTVARLIGTNHDNARSALFTLFKKGYLVREEVRDKTCRRKLYYLPKDLDRLKAGAGTVDLTRLYDLPPVQAYLLGEGQTTLGKFVRGAL